MKDTPDATERQEVLGKTRETIQLIMHLAGEDVSSTITTCNYFEWAGNIVMERMISRRVVILNAAHDPRANAVRVKPMRTVGDGNDLAEARACLTHVALRATLVVRHRCIDGSRWQGSDGGVDAASRLFANQAVDRLLDLFSLSEEVDDVLEVPDLLCKVCVFGTKA